jgi:H+/Cl- antiporter ClcA
VVLATGLYVCGASIGREGPTVQVVAGILRSLTRGLRGGPGRRALILAGGAAGVAAAFNTPIAGVVFAVEELAKTFEKRTHATVILVVVVAGLFGGLFARAVAWLSGPGNNPVADWR